MNKFNFEEFIPKTFVCLKEGFSKKTFFNDLLVGVSIGIISLPLSLAFAVASGVSPEKGLYTAIIAGFLISLLSGSRTQIGGPTGAFIVIIYSIMQRHGYEGLAISTLMASFMLVIMGICRLGRLLRFIPLPVTVGFTSGIAVVIFSSQIKDFFGMRIDDLPIGFIAKYKTYFEAYNTTNIYAVLITLTTLVIISILKKKFPKFPGVMIAIIFVSMISNLFNLPLETIGSKFGKISRSLPTFSFPKISFDLMKKFFNDGLSIALLGAIESLLSALVADRLAETKHKSNCELIAQGLANFGSIIFGGIPATGGIARTAANIKMGAKTPFAGIFNAITLLICLLFLAPYASKIPLSALSAVLIFMAYNMSDIPHFIEILKGQKGDSILLLLTFFLTIFVDLAFAVLVGVFIAIIIFLKRISENTTIENCTNIITENKDEIDLKVISQKNENSKIVIFEIKGPFFYGVSDLLEKSLKPLTILPNVFILNINKTLLIDATSLDAIKLIILKCRQKNIVFLLSGVSSKQLLLFKKNKIVSIETIFTEESKAIDYAKNIILNYQT